MRKQVEIRITNTLIYEIDHDAFVDPWDPHEIMDADGHPGVRLVYEGFGDFIEVINVRDIRDTIEQEAQHG